MTEKFKGIRYPLQRDPRGYLTPQGGVSQIKGDVLALLLTEKNERVMETDFGCGLSELLFEQSLGIEEMARSKIVAAIERYEPRITVQNLVVQVLEEDQLLFIGIRFMDPENVSEVQELSLEVPLNSGTGLV